MTILAVDDTSASLKMLADLLIAEGYQVRAAISGELALRAAKLHPPELVLLDIRMPGMDGYEVCRRLKTDPATKDAAVIFLTAVSETVDKLRGFEAGAVDYITKPFQREELLARVRTHLELYRLRHRLETRVAERTLELSDSLAALHSILDTTLDGYWRLDRQGRLLDVNPAYCQQSGYGRNELIGMRSAELESDGRGEHFAVQLTGIIERGHGQFETQHRRKDGSVWHAEASVTYLDSNDGQFFAFFRDISERKRFEQSLKQAASVFTFAREGIMITDETGSIVNINDAFSRITGYSRTEVLGNNPRMLKSGRHEREFYTAMWHDLTGKGHWYGEIWNRRKNGELFVEMLTISAVRDADNVVRQYVALFSDITASKEHERELEHIAHYDALTGLPNRVLFADRLHQGMAQSLRRNQRLAVAYLDLDGFKAVNDQHGHEAGDQLLMRLAARMKQVMREGDTLARLGGDEFVAVLLDLADIEASAQLLARLLEIVAEPLQIGGLLLQVSASIGVTFYPQDEEVDADQLLRQSDQAMYQAKLSGKNRYHVFDAVHDNSIRNYHESLDAIRRALQKGELLLYYQPKVNLRTGEVIGAEALLRWQSPESGLLLPAVFLPVIENHPLAIEIGEWVMHTALDQVESWQAAGLHLPVSLNIGARQLRQPDFVARLDNILKAHPAVNSNLLELEVLETSALQDLAHVSKIIDDCRKMGVLFSLDDFGTGYSSLTYLKRLPVATIKIDQSFVENMLDDPDDLTMLEGIVSLSEAFRRQVIAEGVESPDQCAMLLKLGCDLAQGYGIARPMPACEMQGWHDGWSPDPAWIDMARIPREELPLLNAGVEHRAWVKAVEDYFRGERLSLPAQDIHHCRFGVWLDTAGRARYSQIPAFRLVEALHLQVHERVAALSRLKSDVALARLGELHQLRNALLDQLDELARQIGH